MKDRALSLKEQEERLGAMVASMQLSKAREVQIYLILFLVAIDYFLHITAYVIIPNIH